jgi:hypothetical protein
MLSGMNIRGTFGSEPVKDTVFSLKGENPVAK